MACLRQGDAEVVVRLREVLLASDGLVVLRDGLIPLALLPQRIAEVVVGLGIVLLEPDGLAILRDGLV